MPQFIHRLQSHRQRKVTRYAGALAVFFLCQTAACAEDFAYVRGMAATCTNCHGAECAVAGGMPVIAGRAKSELFQQLKEFKAGTRPATVMHQLARGFSDEQLELVAGYFAELKTGIR